MAEKQQDIGKQSSELSIRCKGSLLVNISGLGSFSPNFEDGATLFEYVGHSAAVLGTNLTTRLQIETRPENWRILRFDPKEGILDVEQMDGERITPVEDDIRKLSY